MSRADINGAAYRARSTLAGILNLEIAPGDSDVRDALALLNRAMRGDDAPALLQGAALALCMLSPGYGSPDYRGDPLDAVALQQEAERRADDATNESARRIVGSDVLVCLSSLISDLLKQSGEPGALLEDSDVEALSGRPAGVDEFREEMPANYVCEEVTDPADGAKAWRWYDRDALDEEEAAPDVADSDLFDDEEEALRDLFSEERLDEPDGSEAFEHWAVTGWLAEKLRAYGESVADDVCGLTVWARCTTGQMICMDWVFQRIAADINRHEDREPSPGDIQEARDALARINEPVKRIAIADAASAEYAALVASRTGTYHPGAACFAIACGRRFGFDPRDVL